MPMARRESPGRPPTWSAGASCSPAPASRRPASTTPRLYHASSPPHAVIRPAPDKVCLCPVRQRRPAPTASCPASCRLPGAVFTRGACGGGLLRQPRPNGSPEAVLSWHSDSSMNWTLASVPLTSPEYYERVGQLLRGLRDR